MWGQKKRMSPSEDHFEYVVKVRHTTWYISTGVVMSMLLALLSSPCIRNTMAYTFLTMLILL